MSTVPAPAEPPAGPPPPADPGPPRGRLSGPGAVTAALAVCAVVAAAALPWSGGRDLVSARLLPGTRSTAVGLLTVLVVAAVLGALALARPRRAVVAWGVVAALAGAALSAWAYPGLPPTASVGPGPALAVWALVLLAWCLVRTVLRRRPATVARTAVGAVLAAVTLVGAGLGGTAVAGAFDVDASTATSPGPPVPLGPAPASARVVRWSRPDPLGGVAGGAAVFAGRTARAGAALAGPVAVDLATGAERWHHYERGWTVRDLGTTADGTTVVAVVAAGDGLDAVAFDLATGAERWERRVAAGLDCPLSADHLGPDRIGPADACTGLPPTLVVGDGLVFSSAGPPAVDYVDGLDGHTWRLPLDPSCRPVSATATGPVTDLYLRCSSGGQVTAERVVALDRAGRRLWSTELSVGPEDKAPDPGAFLPGAGGALVVARGSGGVALDATTGSTLWGTANGLDPSSASVDGGTLAWSTWYAASGYDPRTGVLRWQSQVTAPATVPVTGGGRVYLLSGASLGGVRCDEPAGLTVLDAATGAAVGGRASLPAGIGSDCPADQPRGIVVGPLLVLSSASATAVLADR